MSPSHQRRHLPTEHVGADRPARPGPPLPSPAVVRASLAGVHVSCVCLLGRGQASLIVLLAQLELRSHPRVTPAVSLSSLFSELTTVRARLHLNPHLMRRSLLPSDLWR